MGLDSLFESSWDLGMYQAGAQQLEPEGTAQTILGLIGDDGLAYRRGGSTFKSNAANGSAGLLWTASFGLPVGERTLLGAASAVKVLAADDATPAALPPFEGGPVPPTAPLRPVVVGGWVPLWGLSTGNALAWAGSRSTRSTTYTTGTVTVSPGSTSVTGVGTSWLANVTAGDLFAVGTEYLVVAAVQSDTALTLVEPPIAASGAGVGYTVAPYNVGILTPSSIYGSRIQASVAGRWVVAAGANVYVTRIVVPTEIPFTFEADDFHSFSASVVGLATLRDSLMVFTLGGVYAVSNMAFDLTDTAGNGQRREELVNADMIAWGHEGIAPWKGALVVPALDGVWILDGVSAPVRISDRIADLYASYVAAGYRAGVAEVFNGTYFLPILTSANVWVTTLACRLQPTHNGGDYAWSQLSGSGAQVAGYAERTSSPPVLLGASTATTSRVLNCTSYFSPAAAVKADADGTTHPFQLVTRNIPTGNNVKNAVKHLKVKYLLTADTGDNPTMTLEANPDGAGWTTCALGGGTPTAGTNDGYSEVYWIVNMAARFIRFRLSLATDDAIQVVPKGFQIFILKSGRY